MDQSMQQMSITPDKHQLLKHIIKEPAYLCSEEFSSNSK